MKNIFFSISEYLDLKILTFMKPDFCSISEYLVANNIMTTSMMDYIIVE